MSGEQEIYSFRANDSNKKKQELQPNIIIEENKEKNHIENEERINNKKNDMMSKVNFFKEENKELVLENKDQISEQELAKAPEYIRTKKEIISSPNLMLVEKKKPKKRMFMKSNSFQVAPIRSLNHKSCPSPNVVRFKFAVNFEDMMINKTEKSIDSVINNNALRSQNPVQSQIINQKFPQEHADNKIQITSERSKKGISICCSNEGGNINCSKCFIF